MRKFTIWLSCLFLIASMGFANAQTKTITGKVTSSEDGLPIPGVTVMVPGTTVGTTTDFNGTYSLTVGQNITTLKFSYIGMESQNVEIDGRTVINVILNPSATTLDEVLVVAYGTIKKSSYTGSAVQVDKGILEKSSSTSFVQALQSKIPGLQISTSSGQPGSAPSVQIRGAGSLNATTGPLYVIDGVPVTSNNFSNIADPDDYGTSASILTTLDPNNIESITTLKDASAASLYGSRAANGVIIITTKSGKKGEKSRIQFDVSYGITDLSVDRKDVLNAHEYFKLFWESTYNDLAATTANRAQVAMDNALNYLGQNPYNVDYPFDDNGNLVTGAKLRYDSDWRDAIYKKGSVQNYSLSVSGGTDKMTHFLSAGYSKEDGIVEASGFERYSFQVNLTSKVNDFINIGTNNSLSFTNQDTPPGAGGGASPIRFADHVANIYPIYQVDEDGKILLDASGNKLLDYSNPVSLDFNPLGTAANDIYNTETSRVLSSLYVEFTFLDDFKFKTLGSADIVHINETRYYNPEHGNGASFGGRSTKYSLRNIDLTISNTLSWNKTFQNNHTVNVLLGQEASKSKFNHLEAEKTSFVFSGNDHLIAGSTLANIDSHMTEKRTTSFFSRLNYNFKDKYYLSGSYRYDGSSIFGENQKWGGFYSVGLTWRIKQEDFMQNITWLNDLKLRASLGTSGNDGILRYKYLGLYGLGFDYEAKPGIAYTQLENNDLHWEKNENFNIGLEFTILDRLTAEIDYYSRKSIDLLFEQPLSFTTGFADIQTNLATMRNSGFELRFISTNIAKNDFQWTSDFNISLNKNKILDLTQDKLLSGSKIWKPDGDRYEFYIQEYAGVNPENGAAMWYKDVTDEEGNVTGRTVTEIYDQADRYELGSASPDFYGGITNNLSYKGWNFSFSFQFSVGGKILDYTEAEMMHDGANPGNQLTREVLNAWKNPGDITNVPKFVINNTSSSAERSSRFLFNRSYLRLQNIMLSYNFPKKWLDPIHVTNAMVYIKGDNLLTWAHTKGLDPELDPAGTTNNFFPKVKTITFGIRLGL